MPPKTRAAKTAPSSSTRKRTTTKTAKAAAPATKRSPGRPRKLEVDPELVEKVMAYVRTGAHPERAAVAAGISERTHYGWQAKGLEERDHIEAGGKPRSTFAVFLNYVEELDRATAEAEMMLLERATKGGAAGTAAMDLLGRRFRDRWSPKLVATGPKAPPGPAPATPLGQLEQRQQARQAAS